VKVSRLFSNFVKAITRVDGWWDKLGSGFRRECTGIWYFQIGNQKIIMVADRKCLKISMQACLSEDFSDLFSGYYVLEFY
jgi:hypothetical protein